MTLSIRLLGYPEIVLSGKPIPIRTHKALALFSYLAVEQTPKPREYLVSLLWPDSNETLGRASLRNALAHLRSALGPYAQDCLISQKDTVEVILPPEIEFDIRSLAKACHELAADPNPFSPSEPANLENEINKLEYSSSLYRGDFLTGVSFGGSADFENWVSQEREHWHQQYGLLLAGLYHLQFSAGQKSATILEMPYLLQVVGKRASFISKKLSLYTRTFKSNPSHCSHSQLIMFWQTSREQNFRLPYIRSITINKNFHSISEVCYFESRFKHP